MSKWTSRKFWLAVIGAGVMVANAAFDWALTTEQAATILLPIIAYIFGEAWVDKSREA